MGNLQSDSPSSMLDNRPNRSGTVGVFTCLRERSLPPGDRSDVWTRGRVDDRLLGSIENLEI